MKRKIILIISCIVFMLSACGKNQQSNIDQQGMSGTQENEQEENQENEKIIIPEKYEKERDNVLFTTEIHVNQDIRMVPELRNVTAILQKIDTEKVYQKLFGEVEVADKDTFKSELNDGSSITEYYYQGKGEQFLNLDERKVMYSTAFYNYVYNCVDTSAAGNLKCYAEDKDFTFATREEALEDITEILGQMGIELGEIEYQVYALDYQTLQQEEYAIDMDGEEDISIYKDSWSEEDNCYYFFIRQKVENLLEYHPYSDLFKNPIEENAPIKVLYSQNGIEALEIERIYNFNVNEDKTIELLPFEEVTEAVVYKYNQLITGAQYVVTDATLYYMTEREEKENYRMLPVWIFNVGEVVESDGETVSGSLLVFVNAETGEEIAMEDKY